VLLVKITRGRQHEHHAPVSNVNLNATVEKAPLTPEQLAISWKSRQWYSQDLARDQDASPEGLGSKKSC
jgi:hypothetical protein